MRINLPQDDNWNLLNQSYRQALGLADDPRFTVQIYTSLSHALAEVCTTLSDLMPNKRTIAHYNFLGPDFDSVAVSLSKKELTLKKFSLDEVRAPEFFTPLAKDLLLLVTGFDDPVTAARHDFSFLETALKDKRHFHIRVANFIHTHEPIRLPSHYEILVLSLSKDRSLVIAGERAKLKPDLTPKLNLTWDPDHSVEQSLKTLALFEVGRELKPEVARQLKVSSEMARGRVEMFERDLPNGITAFFKADEPRIYDRSVLSCEGVDGLSLITRLEADAAGLETTSLCRWQNNKLFDYLYAQNHLPEMLRGLILLDEKLLTAEFKKKLGKVYQELLAEQNETLTF